MLMRGVWRIGLRKLSRSHIPEPEYAKVVSGYEVFSSSEPLPLKVSQSKAVNMPTRYQSQLSSLLLLSMAKISLPSKSLTKRGER